jgi:uncharacterized paraquat-inducible protein A
MDKVSELRAHCRFCKGPFLFPAEGLGQAAPCPHCGKETKLEPAVETPAAPPGKFPPLPNPFLMTCPDCGNSVSKKAEACPQCGRPFKAKAKALTGRDVVFAIILAVLVLWWIFRVVSSAQNLSR